MRCVVVLILVAVSAACGIGSADDTKTLTVLAAASLTDAFGELGTTYERQKPGTKVKFSFAGSQELAAQVRHGSRGDVLATADEKTMKDLRSLVSKSRIFARNSLAIAVAPGNPRNIKGLSDLANPRLRVVLAASNVPAGRYGRQALAKAGVSLRPASEEVDVRSVMTRVRTGEADAGLVYVTDVRAARAATGSVSIPVEHNVPATFPAAAIKEGKNAKAAKAFVSWLASGEARAVLAKYGFAPP